jgi:hypothetical protein
MKNKLILALICLLASCQSYRAERKISKLKSWGYLKDSTITKYDTIRGFTHDSIYFFDKLSKVDTINTVKNGIKVVTVIKWKERQVKQIVTQNDTIFKHKYTTKVIVNHAEWWSKLGIVFGLILFLIILWVIGALVKQEKQ